MGHAVEDGVVEVSESELLLEEGCLVLYEEDREEAVLGVCEDGRREAGEDDFLAKKGMRRDRGSVLWRRWQFEMVTRRREYW